MLYNISEKMHLIEKQNNENQNTSININEQDQRIIDVKKRITLTCSEPGERSSIVPCILIGMVFISSCLLSIAISDDRNYESIKPEIWIGVASTIATFACCLSGLSCRRSEVDLSKVQIC